MILGVIKMEGTEKEGTGSGEGHLLSWSLHLSGVAWISCAEFWMLKKEQLELWERSLWCQKASLCLQVSIWLPVHFLHLDRASCLWGCSRNPEWHRLKKVKAHWRGQGQHVFLFQFLPLEGFDVFIFLSLSLWFTIKLVLPPTNNIWIPLLGNQQKDIKTFQHILSVWKQSFWELQFAMAPSSRYTCSWVLSVSRQLVLCRSNDIKLRTHWKYKFSGTSSDWQKQRCFSVGCGPLAHVLTAPSGAMHAGLSLRTTDVYVSFCIPECVNPLGR